MRVLAGDGRGRRQGPASEHIAAHLDHVGPLARQLAKQVLAAPQGVPAGRRVDGAARKGAEQRSHVDGEEVHDDCLPLCTPLFALLLSRCLQLAEQHAREAPVLADIVGGPWTSHGCTHLRQARSPASQSSDAMPRAKKKKE